MLLRDIFRYFAPPTHRFSFYFSEFYAADIFHDARQCEFILRHMRAHVICHDAVYFARHDALPCHYDAMMFITPYAIFAAMMLPHGHAHMPLLML